MKRLLSSQNERNIGMDYLIVDGEMLTDEDSIVKYGHLISNTDDWAEVYKDDYLEIRKNGSQLLLKSFYNETDIVGRSIYYLYLIEESDNLQVILNYLEKDSQLISRTFDRDRTQDLINKIENNEKAKKTIRTYIAIAIGLSLLIYIFTKI